MVTLADRQYTLDDFFNIQTHYSFPSLSADTEQQLQFLTKKVGAPSYSKTPNFKKTRRWNRPPITENWEVLRNFKATVLKKKDGIEKLIDDVILLLNKITDSNYTLMYSSILELMKKVEKKNCDEKNLLKLGLSIFIIGSANDFYSDLYATLYNDMIKDFPFMKEICIKNFLTFRQLFTNIEYCDAEKDYDTFCRINKDNEKRRAMSHFFINLMSKGIIDVKEMVNLITELIAIHDEKIKIPGNKSVVQEISENFFILVKYGNGILKQSSQWDHIVSYISKIAKAHHKDSPSLSNKTIFKFMDLKETI